MAECFEALQLSLTLEPCGAQVIIALRGTEVPRSLDGFTDLSQDFMFSLAPHAEAGAGRVFKGIYDAWRAVSPHVNAIVDALTEGDLTWSIDVTGNSLGAGLATVATFELAARFAPPASRFASALRPVAGPLAEKA